MPGAHRKDEVLSPHCCCTSDGFWHNFYNSWIWYVMIHNFLTEKLLLLEPCLLTSYICKERNGILGTILASRKRSFILKILNNVWSYSSSCKSRRYRTKWNVIKYPLYSLQQVLNYIFKRNTSKQMVKVLLQCIKAAPLLANSS